MNTQNLITPELIETLYTKYDIDGDGRDSWDVTADIINEIVTRTDFPGDPEYYFHIKEVGNMVQEYVSSTYQ